MSEANKDNHIRFQRLNEVCNKALAESIKVLSDDNLKMCYPILSSTNEGKDTMTAVKGQLKQSWTENAQKEFEAIFKEREIENKLDELDDLIHQAQELQKSEKGKQIPYV